MDYGTTGRRDLGALAAGVGLGLLRWAMSRRRLRWLRGRVVLITGGSRGLGLELARQFGAAGCRVAICGRDGATLARAEALLAAEGIRALALPCDVTDPAAVERLVAEVGRRLGPVEVLVANAVSAITVGPVEALTLADFHAAHDVLYWGVVYPALAVLPQMRERGAGRIVAVTSVGGKIPVAHMLPYTGAKFAATGFAAGLRQELRGSGVRVTTVAPSTIWTGAHLHARYAGRPEAEFAWFARGELMPLLSHSPRRVARRILLAAARGEAEVVIGPLTRLLTQARGLAPGWVSDRLGDFARLALPAPPAGPPARAGGLELEGRVRDPLMRLLARWRRPALRRLNQYPAERPIADSAPTL